jgi:hypothetical protein
MLDSLFHNQKNAQGKLRHKPQTHYILLNTLAASYNPTIVKLKIKWQQKRLENSESHELKTTMTTTKPNQKKNP